MEYQPPIPDKLAHLTYEQIENLIYEYNQGIKTTDLIKKYGIQVTPSGLFKLFPPKVHENVLCVYCKINMWSDRVAKSAYSQKEIIFCPQCYHKESGECGCANCRQVKKQSELTLKREKKQWVDQHFSLDRHEPVSFFDLSFEEKVYIGTILRAALDEDFSVIHPIASLNVPLAPTATFTTELIRTLIDRKIIVPHPDYNLDYFVESKEGVAQYYLYHVAYHLNFHLEEIERIDIIKELLNPPKFSSHETTEVVKMWKLIALEECKQFLLYEMNKVNFEFSIGDKTEAVLTDLLTKFSTAQIYNIIHRGVTEATRYYQEGNVSKKQAANSVVSRCQGYGERAITKGWELTPYNRRNDCPQATLSKFFFERVMQIGDKGFYLSPEKFASLMAEDSSV